MRSTLVILAAGALFAAGCSETVQCIEHENASYNRALAKMLVDRKIATHVKPEGSICSPVSKAALVRKTEDELNEYFYGVAELLRDACEEAAFVEWAKREGLNFEVHDTLGPNDTKGGRMINIRSFTAEERAANAKKLTQAPRGKTC